ncbi:hypothetical protein INR49_013114 [Caranx melampygus]|nr:hypothetical protein INR49_013114 [Caranx melampygus]
MSFEWHGAIAMTCNNPKANSKDSPCLVVLDQGRAGAELGPESRSVAVREGRFHPGTDPHPDGPTGFHSCGGSRALGPPSGWVALPGLSQTLQWGESLCWRCGRGNRHYPSYVHFPWALTLAKTHHSAPEAKVEAGQRSPGFWGVQEHSVDEVLEGTQRWGQGAGGPHDSLLLNL